MKKLTSLLLVLVTTVALFAACGGQGAVQSNTGSSTAQQTVINIAGLKGPTTMGMLKFMSDTDALPPEEQIYNVQVFGTADEITPLLINGELDMAAIPANLAAVLYQKTGGEIQVVAVNTLGVLNILQTGESVTDIESLRGRTIYTTGKGTVPEYTLSYILQQHGLTPGVDVFLEFKSEPAEVGALLAAAAEGEEVIAMLPQPYVTAVCAQNPGVSIVIDVAKEFETLSAKPMVTGVMVARKSFIEENNAAVQEFLAIYEASAIYAGTNIDETAELIVSYGLLAAAPLAKKALPACNIVYIAGEEMQEILNNYFEILYAQNPAAVGGQLPGAGFYYMAE